MGVQIISSTASNLRPLQQCTTTTVCVLVCWCVGVPLFASLSAVCVVCSVGASDGCAADSLLSSPFSPQLLSNRHSKRWSAVYAAAKVADSTLSLSLSTIFSTCHFPLFLLLLLCAQIELCHGSLVSTVQAALNPTITASLSLSRCAHVCE